MIKRLYCAFSSFSCTSPFLFCLHLEHCSDGRAGSGSLQALNCKSVDLIQHFLRTLIDYPRVIVMRPSYDSLLVIVLLTHRCRTMGDNSSWQAYGQVVRPNAGQVSSPSSSASFVSPSQAGNNGGGGGSITPLHATSGNPTERFETNIDSGKKDDDDCEEWEDEAHSSSASLSSPTGQSSSQRSPCPLAALGGVSFLATEDRLRDGKDDFTEGATNFSAAATGQSQAIAGGLTGEATTSVCPLTPIHMPKLTYFSVMA